MVDYRRRILLTAALSQGVGWWPRGATFAADFLNGRYMAGGASLDLATALSFSRASQGWYEDSNGDISEFAIGVPRIGDLGYLAEPAATNLLAYPKTFTSWNNQGTVTATLLSGTVRGILPRYSITSNGAIYEGKKLDFSVTAGETYFGTVYYEAGTSGMFRCYVQDASINPSRMDGAVGSLAVTLQNAGALTILEQSAVAGSHKLVFKFTPTLTGNLSFRVGANSETAGQTCIVNAAQFEHSAMPTSIILDRAALTRAADRLTSADLTGVDTTAGIIVAKFRANSRSEGRNRGLFSLSQGTSTFRGFGAHLTYGDLSTVIRDSNRANAVTQATLPSGLHTLAAMYDLSVGTQAASFDGGEPIADTATTWSADAEPAELVIGAQDTNGPSPRSFGGYLTEVYAFANENLDLQSVG